MDNCAGLKYREGKKKKLKEIRKKKINKENYALEKIACGCCKQSLGQLGLNSALTRIHSVILARRPPSVLRCLKESAIMCGSYNCSYVTAAKTQDVVLSQISVLFWKSPEQLIYNFSQHCEIVCA